MNWSSEITEFWTDSRQALIVTGAHEALKELTIKLGLAAEDLVQVSGSRYALALWDDSLQSYLYWRRGSAAELAAEPAIPGNDDATEHSS